MGWKASFIIVDPVSEIDETRILSDLGFKDLEPCESDVFECVMNPPEGKVYIGRFKNKLLICTQEMPVNFLDDALSSEEITLFKHFPKAEICSLLLHSVVNFWGYSVAKNNEKLRARTGSADDGTLLDFGSPLPEEKELLDLSNMNEHGERVYVFPEYPDEELSEDQVGEEFVFELARRYFGARLDSADEALFSAELNGYSIVSSTKTKSTRESQNVELSPSERKAVRFLSRIGCVVLAGLIILLAVWLFTMVFL